METKHNIECKQFLFIEFCTQSSEWDRKKECKWDTNTGKTKHKLMQISKLNKKWIVCVLSQVKWNYLNLKSLCTSLFSFFFLLPLAVIHIYARLIKKWNNTSGTLISYLTGRYIFGCVFYIWNEIWFMCYKWLDYKFAVENEEE